MKIENLYNLCKVNIKKNLILQIFLIFFYWPILIWWNIPISIASVISNIIFTPFLIIFLALSVLVFFTELFFIPNKFIIYLLNTISEIWIKFLEIGSHKWLINIDINSIPILIFISIVPLLTVVFLYTKPNLVKIKYITTFTFLIGLYASYKYIKEFNSQSINKIYINKNSSFVNNYKKQNYKIICEDSENSTLKLLISLIFKFNISKINIYNWNPSKLNNNKLKFWQNLLQIVKIKQIKLILK